MRLQSLALKLSLKTSAQSCSTASALVLLTMAQAVAGLMANSTRVIIYEQPDQAKVHYSLVLANRNPYPVVSQVWVDDGHSHLQNSVWPNTAPSAAFDVLPTIFKLSAHQIKALRIVQNHSQLPPTQESLMWLNLLEMPIDASTAATHSTPISAKSTSSPPSQPPSNLSSNTVRQTQPHQVNLMMNTQLKLFYRPKALKPMSLQQREQALDFRIISQPSQKDIDKDIIDKDIDKNIVSAQNISAIEVHNPTGYYITFAALQLEHATKTQPAYHRDMMIAPYQHKRFELRHGQWQQKDRLRYILIDDEGQHQLFFRNPLL